MICKCIHSFYYYYDQMPDQSIVQKSSFWFSVSGVLVHRGGEDTEVGAGGSCLPCILTQQTRSEQFVGSGYKSLTATSGDPFPPARFHFLKVPQPFQTGPPLGTKCSNAWVYGKYFIVKPQPILLCAIRSSTGGKFWIPTLTFLGNDLLPRPGSL